MMLTRMQRVWLVSGIVGAIVTLLSYHGASIDDVPQGWSGYRDASSLATYNAVVTRQHVFMAFAFILAGMALAVAIPHMRPPIVHPRWTLTANRTMRATRRLIVIVIAAGAVGLIIVALTPYASRLFQHRPIDSGPQGLASAKTASGCDPAHIDPWATFARQYGIRPSPDQKSVASQVIANVRAQYPAAYRDLSDSELAALIIKKWPVYALTLGALVSCP